MKTPFDHDSTRRRVQGKNILRDGAVMSKSVRPKDLTDKISFGLTKY